MEFFGENTFSLKMMRNYLSESAYRSLAATICEGRALDPKIADEVADAMKTWAMEHGATHYSHWFQPLTGSTAEKHEAFIEPDREGGALAKFSGRELIQGEPDASSFPSGGLRATFEARGYTAWDPTSPAFLRKEGERALLCIPTVFCGYNGEALDNKAPLLRSIDALSKQMNRLGKLFGIESNLSRTATYLGAEQEYFLIDRSFYEQRLDLMQTGRTLFGRVPAKHQQMEDHYFGAVKPRILAFMQELDDELWKLGIPAKTRHNEVSPAQFEIAAMYEELNLAVDHNMQVMQVLREVAERHGLVCLMHEKPFAGVNGSGKHNNWSVGGADGKNWMKPGKTPEDNAKFLTLICALVKAVDENAALLRSTVASAGNDHRLGANEAPPAIISIYLGEMLTKVLLELDLGKSGSSKGNGHIVLGGTALPTLPRDATDRNRTSPFAFTGNKFEFRAVGSSMNCAPANMVLNTITAAAIDEMCTRLEADVAAGQEFYPALQTLLREIVHTHKRILFDGDNYTAEWREEAARRGLPNLTTTPEALAVLAKPETAALFEKYQVLSPRELHSRAHVYIEAYEETVNIESKCMAYMSRTMILPTALAYARELAETAGALKAVGAAAETPAKMAAKVADLAASLAQAADSLNAAETAAERIVLMREARAAADTLETLVPNERWPLPTYADMMFLM
ncbi:MAG: glutamine synthetase III [Lentisphaeria bacterium]|jgi:glutamine synthetase|nr:glutamine synthetase III [Lentisphaeria bacterium]